MIPSLTFSIGSGSKLQEQAHQSKRCPSCSAELHREVGQPWKLVDDPEDGDSE